VRFDVSVLRGFDAIPPRLESDGDPSSGGWSTATKEEVRQRASSPSSSSLPPGTRPEKLHYTSLLKACPVRATR